MNISAKKNLLYWFVLLVALIAASSRVAADETEIGSTGMVLFDSAEVDFEPNEAFFLAEDAGSKTARIKALIHKASSSGKVAARWLFAAHLLGFRPVRFSLVVVGEKLQIYFAPSRALSASEIEELSYSTDLTRDALYEKKAELAALKTQIESQEDELRRLRDDVELIGNFSRVLKVSDEVEVVKTQILNADKDIANLQRLVALLSTSGKAMPINYVRREADLTIQIKELAQAAKLAEANEATRRGIANQDLQQKLALVESTRDLNLEQLQEELAELRAEKLSLTSHSN